MNCAFFVPTPTERRRNICGDIGFTTFASAQFETRGTFVVGPGPSSMVVGDFDHDGKPDLATVTGAILLGKGDGTFEPAIYYTAGMGATSIAAADFDQDGNLDLAVANSLSTNINILLGNGDGTFQSAVITEPPFDVESIGLGDFNGDGKLDLATAGDFSVNILLGNGDGTFRYGASYPGEETPDSIAVADFNDDHKLDLAVTNGASGSMGVLLGNGDGTFQTVVYYPVEFPSSVKAADVNGDHKLDLVVANFLLTSSEFTIFIGNGDGTFRPGHSYPAGNDLYDVAVADFNGDGLKDLAAPDFGSYKVVVLLNTGTFSFSPTGPLAFPDQVIGTISAPQTVTLTNTGRTSLSISSVSASGRFQARNLCGASVAAGASCNIKVSFKPRAAGQTSGLITIVDSASTKPQVIEVTGVGTVVSFSPQALSFPNQKVGTRIAPLTVTLPNKGGTTITLQGVNVGGTNSKNFSENNNCGWLISPGTSCMINVTFAPNATGLRSAAIYAGDNGGGSPQTVPLTGTGD
jgi:hypothetical protein